MWDYTEWKESKTIAETMLDCMQQVNSMVLLSTSKFSALKALITVLTLYEDNVSMQFLLVFVALPNFLHH